MANPVTISGTLQSVLEALGDREPTTVLEAQAITERIRISKGHLDDEVRLDLERVHQRTKDILLRIVEQKRATEAAFTRSISEQLYSTKYRFLYELIQNADDSSYDLASSEPSITFRLTPDTLSVETNEDGFTRNNVQSICETGQSSKKKTNFDQTGEKGFGFKSVFSISHHVHIQSGVWSFRFEHQQEEDGLGMVTPLDTPPVDLPDDVTTQITLKITDTSPASYRRLLDAITDIPETTILFLRRLKNIHVHITSSTGQIEEYSITKGATVNSCTPIRQILKLTGGIQQHETSYLRYSHTRLHMPEDKRRRGLSRVAVDLAFPFDVNSRSPIISEMGQHVFAYLPLQRVAQLPFLIQSDFITTGSRESVIDCAWNEAICAGVADAFCEAVVKHFVTDGHFLQFTWLDYAPTRPMEKPWKLLYTSILDRLQKIPILWSWKHEKLYLPSQLRHMRHDYYFHRGQPVLEDLSVEGYLAPQYDTKHDSKFLAHLGVQQLSESDVLDRIQADLVRPTSRLRSTQNNDAWHESFANLLLHICSECSFARGTTTRLRRLPIIPLANGSSWTGAPGVQGGLEKVYFPSIGSTSVPTSISLNLLHPNAAKGQRSQLYKKMGVEHCTIPLVLQKIEETHKKPPPFCPSRQDVIEHMMFLFYHQPAANAVKTWIRVPTYGHGIKRASMSSLYLPSKGEHDLYQLLADNTGKVDQNAAVFLAISLFKSIPPETRAQNVTWSSWLQAATGARCIPDLTELGGFRGFRLSSPLLAVLERNPSKFLCTLKAHWETYQKLLPFVITELYSCSVPCISGGSRPLEETILPTPEILSRIVNLGLSMEKFPLLLLPGTGLDESTANSWMFLKDLKVTIEPSLEFFKSVLSILQSQSKDEQIDDAVVVKVYTCMAELASLSHGEDLRQYFNRCSSLWDASRKCWYKPTLCRWQGPDFMRTKSVLAKSYGKGTHLKKFFTALLEIKDTSHCDIIEELEHTRTLATVQENVSNCREIFTYLLNNTKNDSDWKYLRNIFSGKDLIVDHENKWYTLDQCVWQPGFPLAGHLDVSISYPTLKTFFVQKLKVQTVTLTMLIYEIEKIAKRSKPQVDDIHQRLVSVGMQLSQTPAKSHEVNAFDCLRQTAFLPKKSGDRITLVKPTDNFAILDHHRYGEAFKGRDVLLDFTMEEVSILHVIFKHLDLTRRYLSANVQEVSVTGDDSTKHPVLSNHLQSKAFALYCCAAKYKSIRALRGCTKLFEELSSVQILTTEELSTNLVLFPKSPSEVRVASDRRFIHHETHEDSLDIYVPAEEKERRSCYRSQLPKLLADIMGIGPTSHADIVAIMNSKLEDLDDVLAEQDIPGVAWIEKPILESPPELIARPSTPAAVSLADQSRHATTVVQSIEPHTPPARSQSSAVVLDAYGRGSRLGPSFEPRTPTPSSSAPRMGSASLDPATGLYTPESAGHHNRHTIRVPPGNGRVGSVLDFEVPTPSRYSDFIGEMISSAQVRAANGNLQPSLRNSAFEPPNFDHNAVFGNRAMNQFVHDKRIGAAGEAFVYELFKSLEIPTFGYENWQSTIRNEVSVNPRFSDLSKWTGRETADLVYTDRVGALTGWLREKRTGIFPTQISPARNFSTHPIEYYLEVKSTTTACNTRFFVSDRQQQRIEEMTLNTDAPPDKVYVLLRVYNMACPEETGLKVFVDPWSLKDRNLKFEIEQWIGKTL